MSNNKTMQTELETKIEERILILGSTGRTGKEVLYNLISRINKNKDTNTNDNKIKSIKIILIIRSLTKLNETIKNNKNIEIIEKSLLEYTSEELGGILKKHSVTSIISCLGHDGVWNGIVGNPKWLILNTTKLVCNAIEYYQNNTTTTTTTNTNNNPTTQPNKTIKPIKYVLMTANGIDNLEFDGVRDMLERNILWFVKCCVHSPVDNEQAADYLYTHYRNINNNNTNNNTSTTPTNTTNTTNTAIEWCVVRPGTLTTEEHISKYEVCTSAKGKVLQEHGSVRIQNVAEFKCELILNSACWNEWVYKMPVILDTVPVSVPVPELVPTPVL